MKRKKHVKVKGIFVKERIKLGFILDGLSLPELQLQIGHLPEGVAATLPLPVLDRTNILCLVFHEE